MSTPFYKLFRTVTNDYSRFNNVYYATPRLREDN